MLIFRIPYGSAPRYGGPRLPGARGELVIEVSGSGDGGSEDAKHAQRGGESH